MTHQAFLSNQADDLKTALTEQGFVDADLERLRRQQQDPYGRRSAGAAAARDIDLVRIDAANRGEGWAR